MDRNLHQKATLAIYGAQLQTAGVSITDFASAQADIAARGNAARLALEKLAASAGTAGVESGKLGKTFDALRSTFDSTVVKIGEIGSGIGSLRVSLTELNQGLEIARKTFGTLSNVAGFFVDQAKAAGGMEDAMAGVQAVTGATAEEFERLQAAAVEASERTRFSSVQAAEGLTELARAGYGAAEAIEVLNPALALAQGQQLSVAQASEYLTTTLTQFGLGASEAARVADVLAKAADSSQTSVQQLGNALGYAAPLANQAGLNIEQTTAIISALADQGFRGERAGTALRNVFSALSDPSSKFGLALRDAGIESRDFATVIEELAAGGDRTKRALLALDAEARPAILALVNAGGAGIGALEQQLNAAAGSAERTAQILGETFLGALTRAQSAIANARNSFLEPLLPNLQRELDLFAKTINDFAKTDDFQLIATNFATAVDQFIQDGKRLAQEVDFRGLLKDIKEFSVGAEEKVRSVTAAFEELVQYPLILGDVIQGGAAVLIESFAGVANDITEVGGLFSEASQNAALFFDDVANRARDVSDREIAQLKERLGGLAGEMDNAREATAGLGAAAREAVVQYQKLALAMLPEPVRIVTQALIESGAVHGDFAAAVAGVTAAQEKAAESTDKGTKSVQQLSAEMELAVQRMYGAGLAYDELWEAGHEGANAAFEEVQKAGTEIARLRGELDAAAASATDLADSFEELGIQSQKSLQAAATRAQEAFDQIASAAQRGEAAQADVNRAFEEYARRLMAVAEQSDDATRQQILRQIELAGEIAGVKSELIYTATASLKAGDSLEDAGNRGKESFSRVRDEVEQTKVSLEEAASVAESSADRVAAAAERQAAAQRNATGAAREAVENIIATEQQVREYEAAIDSLIRRNSEFVDRLRLDVTAQREVNDERERGIELVREQIEVVQQAAAQAGALGGAPAAAGDDATAASATGGRPTTVELVLRNETNSTSPTARLSADQLNTIARTVIDAIQRDMRAAGR
jgi:TP901 family phage tail tape measure protein